MKILFLTKSFGFGGVSVVTSMLANNFHKFGYHVSVFALYKGDGDTIEERFGKHIKLYVGDGFSASSNNVEKLRNIFLNEQIDIVINQWGLPYVPAKLLNKAKHGLGIKVITVYHNDPLSNARLKDVEITLERTTNPIKKWVLEMKWKAFKGITSNSMRYVYNHSDIYMVLSPSYVEHFKKFTGIKNPTKLLVQTNPVTIDKSEFILNPSNKQKEIIYVGRIDYNQKRVYRVIETWTLLEERFPDWKLTIVGDGPERKDIEEQVKEKGLTHVSFEGFQQPIEYYKRVSILMLTSEYEGFPLVLAECMSFGVVPAVYGSYSAVYDIVEDGKDGIILPFDKAKGFDAAMMAERMAVVMDSPEILQAMAIQAMEKSKEYNIDKIARQWENVFRKLTTECD